MSNVFGFGHIPNPHIDSIMVLPRPREVLRPLGAPATGPPPRPVNRSTAALFTDMEKFLCTGRKGVGVFVFGHNV